MKWITKRVFQSVATIFTVITLSFVLIRFMPGGPLDYLRAQLAQSGSMNQRQLYSELEKYLNIDPTKPIWQQYLDYMVNILQGDAGQSFWYQEPVSAILVDALPWTAFVMLLSLFLTFVISMTLGAAMAYHENTNFDYFSTAGGIVLSATPYYIVAVVLLYVLGYQMDLFPTGGRVGRSVEGEFTVAFLISALYHATLPAASYVITEVGGWAVAMRGNSIQILGEDYVRVADLRGLSNRKIALEYVGRNAILPLYTSFMISIGFLLGGSIILEEIFTYPGVGYYLFKAVKSRDLPLMMGGFIVITIAVVIGLLIADLTYGLIDPRAAQGEHNERY